MPCDICAGYHKRVMGGEFPLTCPNCNTQYLGLWLNQNRMKDDAVATTIKVDLTPKQFEVLQRLCDLEERSPAQELRWLMMNEYRNRQNAIVEVEA